MKRKSKIAEEVEAIATISVTFPTALTIILSPVWYYRADTRLMIVLYLLGVIATAALCVAISLHDEAKKSKAKGEREYVRKQI